MGKPPLSHCFHLRTLRVRPGTVQALPLGVCPSTSDRLGVSSSRATVTTGAGSEVPFTALSASAVDAGVSSPLGPLRFLFFLFPGWLSVWERAGGEENGRWVCIWDADGHGSRMGNASIRSEL